LLNESKTYRWEGGELMPVAAASQSQGPGGNDYVKTMQRFEKGKVVEERREPVKPQ
jgi:hypothetical protein